jgi:hypothetical protein
MRHYIYGEVLSDRRAGTPAGIESKEGKRKFALSLSTESPAQERSDEEIEVMPAGKRPPETEINESNKNRVPE